LGSFSISIVPPNGNIYHNGPVFPEYLPQKVSRISADRAFAHIAILIRIGRFYEAGSFRKIRDLRKRFSGFIAG
jgi:hypothetical protein